MASRSSSSASKTDLIVRIRYQNPIPRPPFPPRTQHVQTDPGRTSTYDFLQPLADERDVPMAIDAELGMPLETFKLAVDEDGDASYWVGDRSKVVLQEDQEPLDPEDELLMGDGPSATAQAPGMLPSQPQAFSERKKGDVAWLRKTEYGDAPRSANAAATAAAKTQKTETSLASLDRGTRCAAIKGTFNAADTPLSELRHPTKPHLRAEEAFPLLPDEGMWPNQYTIFRFTEDPSDGSRNERTDHRVNNAILRDLRVERNPNESRWSYFLPTEDDVDGFVEKKKQDVAEDDEDSYAFRFVRDYDITNGRPLKMEYAVTFVTDEDDEGMEESTRRKGAYFAPLRNAVQLRKRRPNPNERPREVPAELAEQGHQFWDVISLSLRPEYTFDSENERVQAHSEVTTAPDLDRIPLAGSASKPEIEEEAMKAEATASL